MAEPYAIIPSHFNPTVYEALESADNVIFFKWDLTDDTFELRDNCCKHRYALASHFSRASTHLAQDGIVHPDDAGMLEYYLHRIYKARPSALEHNQMTARLRLRSNKNPLWVWSEIHLVTYYKGRRPMVAFGNIRNIQAEKLWQQRICDRANTDELTRLYSKGAVKTRIRAALRKMVPKTDTATLLIVDADNFKGINDTFGHLFGDQVLKEVGQAINKNFRQSDIKGRIGGDEFVVFLPGMDNVDVLTRHCNCLCQRLSRIFHADGKRQSFSISVGAAQYPAHGQNYTDLFAHADHALYEAKRLGKGKFVLYQPIMSETSMEYSGRNADTAQTEPQEACQPYAETMEDMQQRLDEMQRTIDYMRKMMCALLKVKS
ncbi:diguanylate cyclase (GGDEF) domain-containing protein [Selenomonas ruminantium]|uniref:Diguanylate cyclase (GGDEF) domain-containing protein n=1 Tax=Selenomonas ruminantium TaxID=971 RepID=A0A1M6TL61_SELRU|nr:GGDEF domain-containing protein [Selenomonas ruminantium]SHK57707.1 diguanylate cyclase (GGDEF) domain-containing protein [Selenomonas ruminantium]